MGFTRHWVRRPAQEPSGAFDALARDAAALFIRAAGEGITVTGPDGSGGPIITGERIAFNGNPGCEPLVWPADVSAPDAVAEALLRVGVGEAGERRRFVKTNRLPYDSIVEEFLRLAAVRYGASFSVERPG